MNKLLFLGLTLTIAITACVPHRKYEELQQSYNKSIRSDSSCRAQLNSMSQNFEKLSKESLGLMSTNRRLTQDSMECINELRKTKELRQESDQLSQKIIDNNRYENEKLTRELSLKNEALKKKEIELNDKEAGLMVSQARNKELASDLALREKRVKELERILRSKDSSVNALKSNLQKALLGFESQGLTVEVRNGKVYVSMDEKLLFSSGSIAVGDKGESALLELSKALKANPDVAILVEGHTDDVPMKSSTIKDNLDLSVLRATSITRILTTKGGIDPKRISSSGRGEYFPVDPAKTTEARAKNRRTEIILTPKLDELFQILGNN
jgi:chemotaxis protein MotB